MATALSHRATDTSGPSMSVLLGTAVFLIAVVLALFVVLPALSRGMTGNSEMNSTVPGQDSGMSNPGQTEMNINTGQ